MSHKKVIELINKIMPVFDEHVIERKNDLMWICKKPGDSAYWFGIALGPSMVTLWGDTDDLILRPHGNYHTFGWATGVSPGNYDYVLGKAPCNMKLKEFSVEDANEYLDHRQEEGQKEFDDARAAAEKEADVWGDDWKDHMDEDADALLLQVGKIREEWDGETMHSFLEAQWEADDDEPVSCEVFTCGTLTAYAALCWWAKQIREDPSYA
jgi:hypothetical protein